MAKKETDKQKKKKEDEEKRVPVSETRKVLTTETGEVTGQEVGGNVFLTPQTETQKREGGVRTAPVSVGGAVGNVEQQVAKQQLEQAGAFEQVTPQEVPLTPKRQFGEEIPIIGASTSGLVNAAINTKLGSYFKGAKAETAETAFPMDEGTAREIALNEIRMKSFKKGISASEAFGSFIEFFPGIGGLASKYAGGLIEAPSSNANEVIGEINKIKEAASTGQEKVRNGLESPDYGLDRARKMEEDVSKLEGRIKLLIITSPILRANNDEVNKIQEEILEAKEKISRYRTAATYGFTAELTGTGRTIPTDELMYLELIGQS